jgi:hypothetical protein
VFSGPDTLWQWTPADLVEVSGPGRGNGPALELVTGIQLDPVHGRVFVADPEASALLSVDLDSGDRTVVSGPGVGDGPGLWSTVRCVYDSGRNVLYAVDNQTDAILVVEVDGGDRVVLSR